MHGYAISHKLHLNLSYSTFNVNLDILKPSAFPVHIQSIDRVVCTISGKSNFNTYVVMGSKTGVWPLTFLQCCSHTISRSWASPWQQHPLASRGEMHLMMLLNNSSSASFRGIKHYDEYKWNTHYNLYVVICRKHIYTHTNMHTPVVDQLIHQSVWRLAELV